MRLKFLDTAKGIAIILVVLGHFLPEGSPHWYVVMRQVIYSFHMPLFLFISGFVYIYSRKDISYGAFLLSKVRRIVVPYIAVSLLFVFMKLLPQLLGVYVKNPVTLLSFLKIFYIPEAAESLWYLWALWWFYIFTPLLNTKVLRIAGLALAVGLYYAPFEATEIFALDKVKQMYMYFLVGAVVADWRDSLIVLKRIPSSVVYLLFAALVVLWLCGGVRLGLPLAFSGTAACLRFASDLKVIMDEGRLGWLETTSVSSYEIYLLHPAFIAVVMAILHAVSLPLSTEVVFVPVAAATTYFAVAGPVVLRKTFLLLRRRQTPRGHLRIGVSSDQSKE